MSLFIPCDGCRNSDWCKRHGCTTWNDHSRWKLDELRRRAKDDNDLIDKIDVGIPNYDGLGMPWER